MKPQQNAETHENLLGDRSFFSAVYEVIRQLPAYRDIIIGGKCLSPPKCLPLIKFKGVRELDAEI